MLSSFDDVLVKFQKKVNNNVSSEMSDGKKVTSRQIQMQKMLATGHFAVVHSGLLAVGNENRHVAIKTLKRTYKHSSSPTHSFCPYVISIFHFHFGAGQLMPPGRLRLQCRPIRPYLRP